MNPDASPSPLSAPAAPARTRPRLPAWARALLAIVAMLAAAFAPALAVAVPGLAEAANFRHGPGALLPIAVVWGFALAAYVGLSWLLVRVVDRRSFRALGLRVDGRAVLALITGVVVAVALSVLTAVTADLLGLGRQGGEEMPAMPVVVLVGLVLLRSFVLQGIGEEVLFRGYLMQSLSRRPVLGVVLAAAAFTLPHLLSQGGQQNTLERVLYLAIPFGFAISAGFLAVAFRSCWAAIGIHGGFHVGTAVATGLGFTTDGPAVWVLVGVLHLLAGMLIASRIPRHRWQQVSKEGPYGG